MANEAENDVIRRKRFLKHPDKVFPAKTVFREYEGLTEQEIKDHPDLHGVNFTFIEEDEYEAGLHTHNTEVLEAREEAQKEAGL